MFVNLYVCLCLIEIRISEPIGTKLCTRLPRGLEEIVGYVSVRNSWHLRTFGPFVVRGQKMAAGATVFRNTFISVIPTGVRATSPTWRRRSRSHPLQPLAVILSGVPLTSRKWLRSRRQSHTPQRRISYSGGCSCHVTAITFNRSTGPSPTSLYPSF
jgi:hypothetical protein